MKKKKKKLLKIRRKREIGQMVDLPSGVRAEDGEERKEKSAAAKTQRTIRDLDMETVYLAWVEEEVRRG